MRAVRTVGGFVAGVVVLAWLLVGCGASAREKTINTTLAALDTSRQSFVVWDLKHQSDIVAKAPDKATYEAEIAKYRSEQTKVAQLFAGAYRAVAAAATLDNDQSLSGMAQAALIVAQELEALGVLP